VNQRDSNKGRLLRHRKPSRPVPHPRPKAVLTPVAIRCYNQYSTASLRPRCAPSRSGDAEARRGVMATDRAQHRRFTIPTLLLPVAASFALAGLAPARNPNEKEIKPAPNAQDPDEIYDKDGNPKPDSKIWVLDFKFKPLRSIKVNVPGRGEQVCYYLWYQVTNKTAKPQLFVPNFELVTHDTRMVYRDEILPTVLDAIAALEDQSRVQKIKSSNSIAP